jgi:hypothetical protein
MKVAGDEKNYDNIENTIKKPGKGFGTQKKMKFQPWSGFAVFRYKTINRKKLLLAAQFSG